MVIKSMTKHEPQNMWKEHILNLLNEVIQLTIKVRKNINTKCPVLSPPGTTSKKVKYVDPLPE